LAHAQAMEGARKDILAGFELVEIPQDTPIAALSGGCPASITSSVLYQIVVDT